MLPLGKVESGASGGTVYQEGLACVSSAATIERREAISREDFSQEYLQGIGKPVVITDATDSWPARGKWTFDFFADRYGSETVLALDNPIKPTVARRLGLGEYLIYCQYPSLSVLERVVTPYPLYASYRPFFKHPELLDDFCQLGFLENNFLQLKGELKDWYNDTFGWLFFGPKGTVTPLHVDHFMTHSWLAQFVGRKRVLLFSPEDADRIPGLSPPGALLPDLFFQREDRSCSGAVQTYEAVLGPGEVIFIPAGWAHTVTSLEPSITMSFDVVNAFNLIPHLMMISRKLPQWGQKINTPAFRRTNQVRWSARDFASLDSSPLKPGQIAGDFRGLTRE